MKSPKKNIRSFRYSDEVAAILMNYGSPDSSINDKFEQLILDCNMRLPEIQKQVKEQQERLHELRDQYYKAKTTISELSFQLVALGTKIDNIYKSL